MPTVTLNESHLVNIANAIRTQNGSEEDYKPREMADAILTLGTEKVAVVDYFMPARYDTGLELPKIGDYAFARDVNLNHPCNCGFLIQTLSYHTVGGSVNESVSEIGDSAFLNQSAMIRAEIPPTCTSIGNHAFSGCNKLTHLILWSPTPVTIGECEVQKVGDTTIYIYVPGNLYNEYDQGNYLSGIGPRLLRRIEEFPEICYHYEV